MDGHLLADMVSEQEPLCCDGSNVMRIVGVTRAGRSGWGRRSGYDTTGVVPPQPESASQTQPGKASRKEEGNGQDDEEEQADGSKDSE